MQRTPLQKEVMNLIEFYESRGWDWTGAVEFVLSNASGVVDKVLEPPRVHWPNVGRPRKVKNVDQIGLKSS